MNRKENGVSHGPILKSEIDFDRKMCIGSVRTVPRKQSLIDEMFLEETIIYILQDAHVRKMS